MAYWLYLSDSKHPGAPLCESRTAWFGIVKFPSGIGMEHQAGSPGKGLLHAVLRPEIDRVWYRRAEVEIRPVRRSPEKSHQILIGRQECACSGCTDNAVKKSYWTSKQNLF
jgi:hypothetical protein